MDAALRATEPPGIDRLAWLLQRHGGAIEYDLAVRGIDLGQLWQTRRWRYLLNLIDRLPANTMFREEQADDPLFAELVASQPAPKSGQRLSDWTPEHRALAYIVDRLADLINAVIGSAGGKPIRIPPYERPVTEIDRARFKARWAQHDRLVARALGKQPGGGDDG